MGATKPVTAQIPAARYDLIREICREREISIADWLREAIREKLERGD